MLRRNGKLVMQKTGAGRPWDTMRRQKKTTSLWHCAIYWYLRPEFPESFSICLLTRKVANCQGLNDSLAQKPWLPTLYQSLDLLPGSFCCQVTYMNGKVLPVMAAWYTNKQVVALAMVALDHLLQRTVTWVVLGIFFVEKRRNQTPVVA